MKLDIIVNVLSELKNNKIETFINLPKKKKKKKKKDFMMKKLSEKKKKKLFW